jgi:hypothetical protein
VCDEGFQEANAEADGQAGWQGRQEGLLMGARGPKPGFRMTDEHRQKISNSNILTYLIQHVEGTRKMSATQVTAALGLLKKVLPDVATMEITGPDGAEFTTVHRIELIPVRAIEGRAVTDTREAITSL